MGESSQYSQSCQSVASASMREAQFESKKECATSETLPRPLAKAIGIIQDQKVDMLRMSQSSIAAQACLYQLYHELWDTVVFPMLDEGPRTISDTAALRARLEARKERDRHAIAMKMRRLGELTQYFARMQAQQAAQLSNEMAEYVRNWKVGSSCSDTNDSHDVHDPTLQRPKTPSTSEAPQRKGTKTAEMKRSHLRRRSMRLAKLQGVVKDAQLA